MGMHLITRCIMWRGLLIIYGDTSILTETLHQEVVQYPVGAEGGATCETLPCCGLPANPCAVLYLWSSPLSAQQLLSNTHTHKLRRKTRSRGGEKKKKKRRRRRVYSQNESATQQSSDGRIDRSIHRLIDRQSVSGGEGGCELWVKQAGEKKEEKHESAAAAAVPGSGFNGLPQQRGTVAEPWPACPRVSVSPGPRGPRAQVGHECVCVCVTL